MATTPSKLPVPSESPRDLKFNAGKIDQFVNSLVTTYIDRFGNEHYTIEGIRWLAQQAIANFGYITLDSFEDGATLTLFNQVLRYKETGEYYRWDGAYPPGGKEVPAGSTPDSTGGIGLGKWLSVGDGTALSALQRYKTDLLLSDGAKNIGFGERNLLESLNDIKHSKDYPTLQDAIDATADKGDLIVSPGETIENVQIGNANLKGCGPATVLKPSSDFSTVIQLNLSLPHWQFRDIGNFKIDGNSTNSVTGIGFDAKDQYAGRYIVSDVYLTGLNKAIEKPVGNIGNTFNRIGINNCTWGYFAKSAPEMHIGSDSLSNMHFDGISTYAIYLNATIGQDTPHGGGIGGWSLKDSIIESSGGGGIYLINKRDCPTAPCLISNVWFEGVATSPAVQVDGAAQKPRVIKLIDTAIFYVEYSYINNIELTNSNLVTYGCRFDNSDGGQDIVLDEFSTISATEAYLAGSAGANVVIKSIASQSALLDSASLSLRGEMTNGRLFNTPSGNKLKGITFDSGNHVWTGSASVSGTVANDGMHAPTCSEFNFPGAGQAFELTETRFNTTAGRWYVWGVNARKLSGNITVNISGGITLGGVFLKNGEWISTFGIGKAARSEIASLRASTAGSSGAAIRLSDFFVAEFSTENQALSFANSRMSLQ